MNALFFYAGSLALCSLGNVFVLLAVHKDRNGFLIYAVLFGGPIYWGLAVTGALSLLAYEGWLRVSRK